MECRILCGAIIMTKFYRNEAGQYLGGFDGAPPAGGIEVPFPPEDARATWNGSGWDEPPKPDIDGFTTAIWEHPALKPLRLNLVSFKNLIQEYLRTDPTRIVEAWEEDIYPKLPDYDPETETSAAGDLVEQLANDHNIQLRL